MCLCMFAFFSFLSYLSMCRNSIIIFFFSSLFVCVRVCVLFTYQIHRSAFRMTKENLFFLIHIYIECLFNSFSFMLTRNWIEKKKIMYMCVCALNKIEREREKKQEFQFSLHFFFSPSCLCVTNEFMWMCLFLLYFIFSLYSFHYFLCCSDNKAYQWYN